MYAIVSTGGKQLKVEKGTVAVVEKLDAAVGDVVTFDVVFVADGDTVITDSDQLASATVTAEIVEHFKGEKQIIFKFKKRKGYKRLKGHRQPQTRVRVTEIKAVGGPAKATKAEKPAKVKVETPAKTEAAPKKAEAKPAAKKAAEKPAAKAEAKPAAKEAAHCAATKADGSPCMNKPKEGSKYCGVHAKKFD